YCPMTAIGFPYACERSPYQFLRRTEPIVTRFKCHDQPENKRGATTLQVRPEDNNKQTYFTHARFRSSLYKEVSGVYPKLTRLKELRSSTLLNSIGNIGIYLPTFVWPNV